MSNVPTDAAPTSSVVRAAVRREMLELAIPASLLLLLQRGVGIVDTAMVGPLGADTLAAAGVANILTLNAMTIVWGLATATSTLVAYHTGADEPTRVRQIGLTSLLTAFALSLVLAALGPVLTPSLLSVLGVTAPVRALAMGYLTLTWVFLPAKAGTAVGVAMFQGIGRPRIPLYVEVCVNVSHIALAYVWIYGRAGFPAMGLMGAAWATVLTESCGALVTLGLARHWRLWGGVIERRLRAHLDDFTRLVTIGLPAAGERILTTSMQLLYAKLIIAFGTAAYAAHQVGLNIEAFAFLPGWGCSQATSVLVGQALGARQHERVPTVIAESLKVSVALLGAIGAVFLLAPQWLVSAFTGPGEVHRLAVIWIMLVGPLMVPMAITMSLFGALRGAGHTRTVMTSTLLGAWATRLPLAFYIATLPLGITGLYAIWSTTYADWLVRSAMTGWRVRRIKWSEVRL